MTAETRVYNEKYTFDKKHQFYTGVYDVLHSNYNANSRIFTKNIENHEFFFKNNKLIYEKDHKFNVSQAKSLFSNLKDTDINPNIRSTQEKISYYLTNRLVPGFNSYSFNDFKKENTIIDSKELSKKDNYIVDKWYFQKKNETKSYYEKYFWENEIEKMRKKNIMEKKGKDEKVK